MLHFTISSTFALSWPILQLIVLRMCHKVHSQGLGVNTLPSRYKCLTFQIYYLALLWPLIDYLVALKDANPLLRVNQEYSSLADKPSIVTLENVLGTLEMILQEEF